MSEEQDKYAQKEAHYFDKYRIAWMWRDELPNDYVGLKIGNEHVELLEYYYGKNFPVILKGSKSIRNAWCRSPHAASAEAFFWRAIRMSKETLFYEDYGRSKKLNNLIEKINVHIRRRYPRTRFTADISMLANEWQFLLMGVKLYGSVKEQKNIMEIGKGVRMMEKKGAELQRLKQKLSVGSICL